MNDILKTTMAVITAVAVMAVVFVPMTMEFGEQAHYTVNRNEGGYYTLVEDNKKVVVEVDTINASVTINGKTYDLSTFGTYLVSDYALMDYSPADNGTHNVFTENKAFTLTIGSSTMQKLTITFENGNATVTDGTNTYNGTYTYLLHYSGGSGNYIQTSNVTELNVNKDSKIFFINNGGSWSSTIIGGPFEADQLRGSADIYTVDTASVPTKSTTTISWTLEDNGDETYKITNPTYSPDATELKRGIVPVKYQVYNEDSMVAFMVNILPVLVGLAFLAGIGIYITRFKDQ